MRSSGAWATLAPPPSAPEPEVHRRAPHELYADACREAHTRLTEGLAADAATAARRALETLPRGLEAQRLLGLALLEQGESRPAANAFAAVLGADPLDLVALVGSAEAQEQLDGAGAAEAAWRRAWELDPGNVVIGERLQAARRAAGVLDVKPGRPPLTRHALTRIHIRGGLFEHAAIEARAVLAREPERDDVRLSLAEAFWRAGDSESAATVAAELVEKHPECVAANLLLAAHWQAEGRDASELLARIQAVDPSGTIAARLFDDREVPALFGTAPQLDQLPELPPTVISPPATPPVIIVEPEPIAAVERAEEPEIVLPAAPETEPEPQREPEPIATVEETQPLAVVEPPPREIMIEEAPPEPEPIAAFGVREPVEAEELVALVAHDSPRHRGDAAMRERRYADAAREYGAWLRALRGEQTRAA